jgi:hypothetical protein
MPASCAPGILALADDPQSTSAWNTGAIGEERLGTRLNELSTDLLLLLHDRRIPRSKANTDHVAIAPNGIWVIDAKKNRGRPALKVEGGFIKPRTEKLIVGGFSIRGVEVLRPKKLYPRLKTEGAVDPDSIAEIHRLLAAALPPA